jgi:hypothetical protein
MNTTYGFWIVGPCCGERRLIDWSAAFAAYAALDERADVQREAYLSAFTFGEDFRQHLESNGTTKGFDGVCWGPWLWFDIDRTEHESETARRDTARLALSLVERYRFSDDDLLIFFSGSKGFHVGMPTAAFGPEPSPTFHRGARKFAEGLAEAAGVSIDTGIYDKVRAFRAPNSRHAKTGLYKRPLSLDELVRLSIATIRERAQEPRPFDVPDFVGRHQRNDQAVADWQAAVALVAREAEANAQRRANGTAKLNRGTLELIRSAEPIAVGDRHRLLFSAAANLAECDCPPELAHQLLTEAGRDCGLPPAEVKRQIDCGLQHVHQQSTANGSPSAIQPNQHTAEATTAPPGKLFGESDGGYYHAGY